MGKKALRPRSAMVLGENFRSADKAVVPTIVPNAGYGKTLQLQDSLCREQGRFEWPVGV